MISNLLRSMAGSLEQNYNVRMFGATGRRSKEESQVEAEERGERVELELF